MNDADAGRPVFALSGTGHAAAKLMGEQLHPITNPQQRDAGIERRWVGEWCAIAVHAGWPAGENQRSWMAGLDAFPGRRSRDQFAIDARFPHPAGDQLAVLRAEVQHQHQLRIRPHPSLPRRGKVPFADLSAQVGRKGRRGYVPIPTCWFCWKSFPSLWMAGAITISVSWNSCRLRAPQTPI